MQVMTVIVVIRLGREWIECKGVYSLKSVNDQKHIENEEIE